MRLLMCVLIGGGMMAAGAIGKTFTHGGVTNLVEAKARRDEVVRVVKDDPAMLAAYQRGRETLSGFLAVNENRPPNSRAFAVKIPVRDGNMVEWFWVNNFVRDGDQFRGAINNLPRSVRTVREGQDVRFTRSDIVDWMYMHDGRLKGGFTSCALLNKDPNVQARTALIRKLGMDCEV